MTTSPHRPTTHVATTAPVQAPQPTRPVTRPPAAKPTTQAPPPAHTTTAAPANCDPAYSGVCLRDGIGDYDCAGGSGNGPNYADGPITVVKHPDPFGLDADGDGVGCE